MPVSNTKRRLRNSSKHRKAIANTTLLIRCGRRRTCGRCSWCILLKERKELIGNPIFPSCGEMDTYDPDDTPWSLADLMIVEAGRNDDRRMFALAGLQNSALYNGMVLQLCFTPIKNSGQPNYKNDHRPVGKFTCQIFLKGENVSEHTGWGMNMPEETLLQSTVSSMCMETMTLTGLSN